MIGTIYGPFMFKELKKMKIVIHIIESMLRML